MDDTLRHRYRTLRPQVAEGMPITVLHIGADQTVIVAGTGPEPAEVLVLAIGSGKTAAALFHHNPPTPGELENAIQIVEDEVTRARALAASYPSLWSTDPAVPELAQIAGVSMDAGNNSLSIEAVEQLFDLLASLSLGRPAASAGIPNTPTFAATLLILREFMHHLGFADIRWPG
ncbi:hypothetical protein [Rhodoferax sp.]|uniref:hypothetical protein n=1 Tax=Rhodoferax sp. TaxID=50421 RepID=UPI00374DF2D7